MKGDHIEERLHESDAFMLDVTNVIIQLRANAARLEYILQKFKEDEESKEDHDA